MSDVWSAISALSSAIGTGIVIIAAVYARGQVREARQTREVALLQNIYERYNDLELRRFRTRLMRSEITDFATLDQTDRDLLARNLDQLEFIAITVERGLLDFDMVYSVFPNSPPRLWEAAHKVLWTRSDSANTDKPLARFIARYPAKGDSRYREEGAEPPVERSQPAPALEPTEPAQAT